MSFPRYPEYKDSGVEWLGEVPVHWTVCGTGHRLKSPPCYGVLVPDFDPDGVPMLKIMDLTNGTPDRSALATISQTLSNEFQRTIVRPGDVVLSVVGTIGTVLVVPEALDGINLSRALARLLPNGDLLPQWLVWIFSSDNFVRFVDLVCVGSAQRVLNMDDLRSFRAPFPPIEEQTAIATFLDHETAKIDALVAEQEKLITLLQEKRQAVISHAVTKGLNPNVPMKDSGVEWLGEVPEHWAVGKCGFYLRILSGFAFPSSGFTDDDSDHRLLRGANVGVSRLKWDDTVYWQRSEGDGLDDYEMVEGDLVIGMDRPLIGEGMRVAKVTAEDLPSLLLQRVASLKVGSKLHADYLHYLLASEMFIAHFSPETTGVSVPHISPDQINKFIIPIPPMSEQLAIVNDVKRLLTEFGGLIAESEIAITLLQERRSALISAAVTGQIDVRNWSVSESA